MNRSTARALTFVAAAQLVVACVLDDQGTGPVKATVGPPHPPGAGSAAFSVSPPRAGGAGSAAAVSGNTALGAAGAAGSATSDGS